MTNLIVLSFTDDAKAIQASHKLAELEYIGDISIFEKVIIKKGANGEFTYLQTDTSDGARMASGMALGTLVGVIGGPVGMLVGMLSGTLVGAAVEADYVDFSEAVVRKVTAHLNVGDVAILAEISEDGSFFVDSTVASLGANIFRYNVDDAYSDYEDEQVRQFDNEIAEERKQFKAARSEDKARVKNRIEQLKEKRRQRIAAFKEKANDRKKARLTKAIDKEQAKVSELKQSLNKLEN